MRFTENMRNIKRYDDEFQAIRAVSIPKILNKRILSQMKAVSRFLSNA